MPCADDDAGAITTMLKPRTKPPAFIITSCGGESTDYNRLGDFFGTAAWNRQTAPLLFGGTIVSNLSNSSA